MKKINSKIASKLEEKLKENNIVTSGNPTKENEIIISGNPIKEEKTTIVEIIEPYVAVIDYSEYELDNIETNDLLICEQEIMEQKKIIHTSTLKLSKYFHKAHSVLANKKVGTFTKWFESLGFKKDFVYMLLKRNELYIETSNEKVFEIPEKAIKTISKFKEKLEENDIIEIVNAEKPSQVAKEKEHKLVSVSFVDNVDEKEKRVDGDSDEWHRKMDKRTNSDIANEIKKIKNKILEHYSTISLLEEKMKKMELHMRNNSMK